MKKYRAEAAQRKLDLPVVARTLNAGYTADDLTVLPYFKTVPLFPGTSFQFSVPRATDVMRSVVDKNTPASFFDFRAYIPTSDDEA